MKVQSIYTSKILKKGLKFAAENGMLFGATASLAFSTIRPMVILATPGADKENKQVAGTKAIASTLIGYAMMMVASLPIAHSVKEIDKNPSKYLKLSTIAHLQAGEKTLSASSKYSFATQLFKLGSGALVAVPKSVLTCAIIPPILNFLFKEHKNPKDNGGKQPQDNRVPFTGIYQKTGVTAKKLYQGTIETLAQKFGRIIDSGTVKNLTDKFHDTKFEQHIITLTDMLSTGAFIGMTARDNKFNHNDKKLLIYNSLISTGLSIGGMYIIDDLTKKPTEKFIENFKKANANSKDLGKYIEGIKIAKPLLILGTIYYAIIPLLSTFFADKLVKKTSNTQSIQPTLKA